MGTRFGRLVAALVAILICSTVLAEDEPECNMGMLTIELQGEGEAILNAYLLESSSPVKECSEDTLEKFRKWNAQIKKILVKTGCTWEDIPGVKKIETLADLGCKEQTGMGLELELEPLVPPEKEVLPDLVELPSSEPTVATTLPKPEEPSYWLAYTGIGVGAIGLGLLGGGTYFGVQSQNATNSAHDANFQLEVHRFNQEAEDHASKANILLATGGVILVAGATLTIINLVWSYDPPANPSTSVGINVTPDGANASLIVRF